MTYFMFCGPSISIHLCNKNQLDALFILSLFRQSTSTCFGHICSPSPEGILYIYNNWYVLCFSIDCLLACRPTYIYICISSLSSSSSSSAVQPWVGLGLCLRFRNNIYIYIYIFKKFHHFQHDNQLLYIQSSASC